MKDIVRILMLVILTTVFMSCSGKQDKHQAIAEEKEITTLEDSASNYFEVLSKLHEQGKWDQIIEYSDLILLDDSLNITAYNFLSEAYRQKKDYNSAIQSTTKILALTYKGEGGEYTEEEMKNLINTQVVLGNLFYRNGEYEKALNILEPTIDVEYADLPHIDNLFIYCNLSVTHNKLGNIKESNKYADLAMQIDEVRARRLLSDLLDKK